MFMAERGIELPKVEVDIRAGENRREPYLAKNPSGQCPALQLDDGRVISEITAICEYLDEVSPGPSLIGATAEEIADARDRAGVRYERSGDLERAVRAAAAAAEPGEIVLLSPSCASYDQFENFEQRGEAFRRLVEALE